MKQFTTFLVCAIFAAVTTNRGQAFVTPNSRKAPTKVFFQSEQVEQQEAPTSQVDDGLERLLTKRKSLPFLVEKAAEVAEMTFRSSGGGTATKNKEKVVVLGTGWGAATFLQNIDTDLYDVTVVSPRNYFLFTPMLAGATVGTVEYRSICLPIREICPEAKYLETAAEYIDPAAQTVTCESVICDGGDVPCEIPDDFDVPYDRLVISVGAKTNTFGVPGVQEYCSFLKSISDARRIRRVILNCFERANLPGLTEPEIQNQLTFVIIGGGPTGVEFASELRDFLESEGPKYYLNLLKYVKIQVLEGTNTVLAPFDKPLQEEAIRRLQRETLFKDAKVRDSVPISYKPEELLLETQVKEITKNKILLGDGRALDYGMAVWAAGNGPLSVTKDIIDSLGPTQAEQQAVTRGRIAIDPWLRVIGGEGKMLSIGDCACRPDQPLPSTAQVALQQGEYLALLLNKQFDLATVQKNGVLAPPTKIPGVTKVGPSDWVASFSTGSSESFKPFQFFNLGILAYTGGNSALAQLTPVPDAPAIQSTGFWGNQIWRGVYLYKQLSWRNRLLIMGDWAKRKVFGRDITRLD